MSHNIDCWHRIDGEPLTISKENFQKLEAIFAKDHPDGLFVDQIDIDDRDMAKVPASMIYGEGSGWFYESHIGEVAKLIEG